MRIPESELILNDRGAVYHLNLLPEELAPIVITVGDPGRVAQVSKYFDTIEIKREHREFVTHTGILKNKRISVVSTGIGTDNIDIVFNELDALVNIDFRARVILPQLTSLNIIRIGTCGSLQGYAPEDSFIASTHGLGLDNLLNFYIHNNNEEEKNILQHFCAHTQLNEFFSKPYIASASSTLLKHFVDGFHHGITVTCPGFYGPQGRVLRLGLSNPELINHLTSFRFGNYNIINFEMETAGIYGLGKLLDHHCLSLSAVIANRVAKKFSEDAGKTIDKLIKRTLEIITSTTI
ncbi:MAG: nucleoside phosphorylase [Bacteroidetes bacterium]|nr:nucleoside phosphorylase [Bacteroidota bacterium]